MKIVWHFIKQKIKQKKKLQPCQYSMLPLFKLENISIKLNAFALKNRNYPDQEVDIPVSFFIDPAIKDDKFINDLSEITLSYTMFVR